MNSSHHGANRLALRFRQVALVLALILTFSALLCAETAAPAAAAAPATTVSPEALMDVLQVLQTKGVISQQEFDSLKTRVAASAQPVAAPEAAAQAAEKQGAPFVRKMDKGVGLHIGDVDVSISGEINAFYVHDRPTKLTGGPILGLASAGTVPNSSVRNGLLPSNFNVNVATHQAGWDVGVTFGIYPGIQNLRTGGLVHQGTDFNGSDLGGLNLAPGNPTGFGTPGIDFRQQFVTFGRKGFGTVKAGRDIGLFGQEAILNDMTLLGAGTTNGNKRPGSVTLGRIGLGYVYTDFQPQITYTTPSMGGLQLAFGVFTPLEDVVPTTLALPIDASLTGKGQPQFQGKLTYTVPAGKKFGLKLWTNFMTQSMQADLGEGTALVPTTQNVRSTGVDFGGKLSIGAADFVAYGYQGFGVGTEGLLFLSTSPTGDTRDSDGFYVQATYTFAKKFLVGASYGRSRLDLATGENATFAPLLVRENRSWVGQTRYKLTPWVNLVGEYTHSRASSHGGSVVSSDSIAVGPIVFF